MQPTQTEFPDASRTWRDSSADFGTYVRQIRAYWLAVEPNAGASLGVGQKVASGSLHPIHHRLVTAQRRHEEAQARCVAPGLGSAPGRAKRGIRLTTQVVSFAQQAVAALTLAGMPIPSCLPGDIALPSGGGRRCRWPTPGPYAPPRVQRYRQLGREQHRLDVGG